MHWCSRYNKKHRNWTNHSLVVCAHQSPPSNTSNILSLRLSCFGDYGTKEKRAGCSIFYVVLNYTFSFYYGSCSSLFSVFNVPKLSVTSGFVL
jgi:hypothetical protein